MQIVVAPWIHEGWVIYDHRIHHGPSKDPSIEKRLRDSNNASLRLLCVLHRVYFFAYVHRFWIYVELTFWVSHPLISFCDLRKIFVKLTALKCPFCVAVVVDVVDCSLNKKKTDKILLLSFWIFRIVLLKNHIVNFTINLEMSRCLKKVNFLALVS